MASFFWWLILFSRLKVSPTDYWLLQSSNYLLCCHYYRHYYCETFIAYLNVCLVWIALQHDESINSLKDEIRNPRRHLGEAKVCIKAEAKSLFLFILSQGGQFFRCTFKRRENSVQQIAWISRGCIGLSLPTVFSVDAHKVSQGFFQVDEEVL